MVDRENGSFLHYPFDGGYYDQPYRTMMIYERIRDVFIEKISADIEAAKNGRH